MLKECNVWEITNRPIDRKIIKNHWVFVSRVLLLKWCRDNSIVWENPVRENTTHYTVEYTCKRVLVVSYHAVGCERTCICGSKSLIFIRKELFILVCV